MNHKEVLEMIYNQAISETAVSDYTTDLPGEMASQIELLVSRSETNKGLIAVLTTLLIHKIVNRNQDIRYHQAQQEGGFAGRSIDKDVVTPFMKSVSFPSMAESGWLTRSLEQPHPYTMDYPGKIKPDKVKKAFLVIIDSVQIQGLEPERVLLYFFKLLIKQRDDMNVELAKPHSLSIAGIVQLLEKHFTYKYNCAGASRLPTLAIYAAYQCMMSQLTRYQGKILCPLESHNSADKRSGRIGDIDVNNESGDAFEGVEVKHGIPITRQLVADAYEKFKMHKTSRYYLLTTANMDNADWHGIEEEIKRIGQIHGCQVIVNGVYSTLKYYLRLLEDPAEFTDHYVELLKSDDTIKYQHRVAWNELVSRGVE
ncbi:MAG: hypothetical protein Q4A32_04310 [Lachnospiraceae bacterium]|nr:hypothetical protein [Lachnospiraceae bacterium]